MSESQIVVADKNSFFRWEWDWQRSRPWCIAGILGFGTAAAICWLSPMGTGNWPAKFVLVTGSLGVLIKIWADYHFDEREKEKAVAKASKDPEVYPAIDELTDAVDTYCEQRSIRELEHPWLLCSLATFAGAFAILVRTEHSIDLWSWPFVIAIAVSCLTMIIAGIQSANEPDKEQVKILLDYLATYRPVDKAMFSALLSRILGGDLSMEELAMFAAHERQETENGKCKKVAEAHLRGK